MHKGQNLHNAFSDAMEIAVLGICLNPQFNYERL